MGLQQAFPSWSPVAVNVLTCVLRWYLSTAWEDRQCITYVLVASSSAAPQIGCQ